MNTVTIPPLSPELFQALVGLVDQGSRAGLPGINGVKMVAQLITIMEDAAKSAQVEPTAAGV